MKRLVALFFLLTLACPATARLYISVNGIIDPPDNEIMIRPSEIAVVGIHGDGLTPPPWEGFLIVEGPASIDGYTMYYTGPGSYYKNHIEICEDYELCTEITESFWYATTVSMMRFGDSESSPPLRGMLLDGILLHAEYPDAVIVSLVGSDLTTFYDMVVILVLGTGLGYHEPGQLLADWKLDEGQGLVAFDSVSYNHGLVIGAEWAEGPILGALRFDGADDCVRVRPHYYSGLNLGHEDGVTISAWVRTDRDGPIINRRRCTAPGGDCCAGYQLDVRNEKLFFEIEDNDTFRASIRGDTELTDDQWHHVVAVRDIRLEQLRVYVDGFADAASVPDTTIEDLYTTADLQIGRAEPNVAPGAEYYKGIIDDVRIYYGVLPDAEIRRIYREVGNRYVLYVNPADGNDTNDGVSPQTAFATIQKAIDWAGDGDTIIAAPGIYTGRGNRDIDFKGRALGLLGQGGPENCIIDCNGSQLDPHQGFYFHNEEDGDSVINGFTIINGYAPRYGYGGAVECANASPTITNCRLTGNYAEYGGAISTHANSPTLINCILSGNSAYRGGAIEGGPRLTNCTITGNQGAGSVLYYYYSVAKISSCVIWGNASNLIRGDGHNSPRITYTNIQGGWPGQGNINADPCFADIGHWDDDDTPENPWDDFYVSGDYHLKSQGGRWDASEGRWVMDEVTSPCIDAGNPMSPIGLEPFPNGGIINMGAYGGTAEASKSYFGGPPCETIVAGDINGDCIVDFRDLCIMAVHWCEED